MRKFLIFLCLLIPYCCFSQLFEDFSDSGKFAKNGWDGDLSHFILSSNYLRLNNNSLTSGSCTSYLSAPCAFPEEKICWQIDLELRFNPSSNNHAFFYLTSNQPVLSGPLRGYCLQVGGKDDEVALIKENSDQRTTLICIPGIMNASGLNRLSVKVIRNGNTWELYTNHNSQEQFTKAGQYTDPENLIESSGYLGWKCIYTKTYATKFYLDRIEVSGSNAGEEGDPIIPPVSADTVYIPAGTPLPTRSDTLRIDSVSIPDANTMLIYFNNPLIISKGYILISPDDYSTKIKPTQFPHILHCSVTPDLQEGESYFLVSGGMFSPENIRYNFTSYYFSYSPAGTENPGLPEENDSPGKFGDIAITEIMSNPKGVTLLPEVEYVELYNRTSVTLSLGGCIFYYGTKGYPIETGKLDPGQYVILCHESKTALFPASIPVIGVRSFPMLANTGKQLYLENPAGELLHRIEYSDKWFSTTAQRNGGTALEMIDTGFLDSSSANWKGSVHPSGGTPGAPNSVAAVNPDSRRPYLTGYFKDDAKSISLSFSKPIHPDQLEKKVKQQVSDFSELISTDYPLNRNFRITFGNESAIESMRLSLNELTCIDQLPLYSSMPLSFPKEVQGNTRDTRINEMMFLPKEDSAPFIELWNNSDEYLDLSRIALALTTPDSMISNKFPLSEAPALWAPRSYAVVTTVPHDLFDTYGYEGKPHIIALTGFPQPISGKNSIALIDPEERIAELVPYRKSLHDPNQKNITGISLERRDVNQDAALSRNWTSGHASTRFATPGYANYADSELPPNADETAENHARFRLRNHTLRLNADSPDSELTIIYQLPEEEVRTNITLYTSTGIKVCRLAEDQSLHSDGELTWENEWRTRRSETPGIYILLIEYLSDNGIAGKEKIALPIIP